MILVIARAIVLRDSCALIFATMIRKWGYQMKMSKPCLFVAGVVFFALVLVATDAFLPLWLGVENGVIENLQVVILAVAMYVCKRKMTAGGGTIPLALACGGLDDAAFDRARAVVGESFPRAVGGRWVSAGGGTCVWEGAVSCDRRFDGGDPRFVGAGSYCALSSYVWVASSAVLLDRGCGCGGRAVGEASCFPLGEGDVDRGDGRAVRIWAVSRYYSPYAESVIDGDGFRFV